jgi:hypothetical protein
MTLGADFHIWGLSDRVKADNPDRIRLIKITPPGPPTLIVIDKLFTCLLLDLPCLDYSL